MQTNSIGLSIQKSFGFCPYRIGIGFCLLFLYILLGGSRRIMKASEYIIPIKVFLFFIGIISLLIYHHTNIIPAFWLVMDYAFTTKAIVGGIAGYTMQRAITVGFSKALNATEVGVGTAGIFFGATESKDPLRTSILSMLTAFISTNLVCAAIIFSIVVSGVPLNSGATSTELVILAFETVIGKFAGPAVTFLSFSFGIGVIVAYTFLGYKIWEFLFGNKTLFIYYSLAVFVAFLGAVVSVDFIWNSLDFLVGILIFINLIAVLWNIKKIKAHFDRERKI
jgi:AGCS family alanine or glycine:cation symporter